MGKKEVKVVTRCPLCRGRKKRGNQVCGMCKGKGTITVTEER